MSDDANDILSQRVVSLDRLRVIRGERKRCTCLSSRFLLDTDTRDVTCRDCGARVDAFDALVLLSERDERWEADVRRLQQQRVALLNWRPYRVALRALERAMGDRHLVPQCPHCHAGMLAEDIELMAGSLISREAEEERRAEVVRT